MVDPQQGSRPAIPDDFGFLTVDDPNNMTPFKLSFMHYWRTGEIKPRADYENIEKAWADDHFQAAMIAAALTPRPNERTPYDG